MYSWYELALIAFILLGIGTMVWRGGAANPVGTGGLDRKVASIDGELKRLGVKVGEIDSRVEDIDRRAAKVSDIKRLERQLEAQDAKIDVMSAALTEMNVASARKAATVDHVKRQIDRLYDLLVEKGMKS